MRPLNYWPAVLWLAIAISASADLPSASGKGPSAPKESADLEDLLVNGLKARTSPEKAFIAKVVQKVAERELPENLVKAVFHRARSQHGRYPLPHFMAMIKQVAKQRGVTL